MNIIEFAYTALMVVFVLFAPGFFISILFFDFGRIEFLERVALSFALSLSVIPLLTFYLNLLGIKINMALVVFEVIFICVFCTGIFLFRNYQKNISR